MERLLHYVWQHRLYPYDSLLTEEGQEVEVIDPGIRNTNAGPDFLEAKLKIGQQMWVGNVEIHHKSSEWYAHHHDSDEAYNNVILHVVELRDQPAVTAMGRKVPQVTIAIPPYVETHYNELLRAERIPPCHQEATSMPSVKVQAWMDRLATERLREKTERIQLRAETLGGDWEHAFFIALARSFGFGINGEAFEEWATHIPPMAAGKHRDDLFQIEALFLGQAGLLQEDAATGARSTTADDYFRKLQAEYRFLAHKFGLQPMDSSLWRFLRLRPQNFPHIRIAQMARLYVSRNVSLSKVIEAENLNQVRQLFQSEVSPYWETHYTFGKESPKATKAIRKSASDSIVINAAVPLLFAYGAHRTHPEYGLRAMEFLLEMKAEQNHIIRLWKEAGFTARNAAESQALIQLHHRYCNRKDCLRCAFGMAYLEQTKVYHVLQESDL